MEHASPALVHVRADERPGWWHLQVRRWWHHVVATHGRTAGRRDRAHWHRRRTVEFTAYLCGRRLPRAGSRRARAPATGCGQARGRTGRPGRLLPLRRRRRHLDAPFGGPGAVGAWLVLREGHRRSEECRHRICAECRRQPFEGRWQELGHAARLTRGRRLPSGVGVAGRLEYHDRRERPGRDRHAQCDRRRSAHGDVELVAQPADRAALSHRGRLPHALLGDRRAAGQRRRRCPLAREVRRDLHSRLGADWRRRRERLHRGRSAQPGHHLRRLGHALQPRDEHAGARHHFPGHRSGRPRRLDATARRQHGGSHVALLREPVPLQVHGRRQHVDEDQSRPHAFRSRRTADSRCDRCQAG